VRFAVASAVLLLLWANHAFADLYRWVDPETGSVKFSSYPPPWFGDAAREPRAPKVEVIPPTRTAPAFEAVPNAEPEPAAQPAESANDDPRGALLKQLAQRVAAFISSAPDAMGKASADLLERLQELERLDRQIKFSQPKDEAVRLEEKLQLAAPLESHRTALLQQIASLGPPPAGSPRDRIESAWLATQRLLAALEWTNGAINGIDSRKANARHFEMNALVDRLVALWEPYIDPSLVRRARGR